MGRKHNDTNYPIKASCAGRELHCSRSQARSAPRPRTCLAHAGPHFPPVLKHRQLGYPVVFRGARRPKATMGSLYESLLPRRQQVLILQPFISRKLPAGRRDIQVSQLCWLLGYQSNPRVSLTTGNSQGLNR